MNLAAVKNLLHNVKVFRGFHTTALTFIKQITATENGNVTVIKGEYLPSSREPYMVKNHGACNACPVCSLGLVLMHTDVLILHQFLRADGCLLPRRVTGLCYTQQKRISYLVGMAQKAGILYPPGSKVDPRKRQTYKKFNTYFDESTIDTWWKSTSNSKK